MNGSAISKILAEELPELDPAHRARIGQRIMTEAAWRPKALERLARGVLGTIPTAIPQLKHAAKQPRHCLQCCEVVSTYCKSWAEEGPCASGLRDT